MATEVTYSLGRNLEFLRKNRGLTQAQLSQVSGIPRTTLSYIESGQGNPSLKTLVKIASCLGVTLEELLAAPRPLCLLIKESQLKHQVRAQGRAIKTILLPDPIPGLQFECITLKAKSFMLGTPHSRGTKEYFTCIQGCISVFVDGQNYLLDKGDVFAFPGDSKHSYHNLNDRESQGISIVVLHMRE